MKKSEKSTNGTSFHNSTVISNKARISEVCGDPDYVDNSGQEKVNFEWIMETEDGFVSPGRLVIPTSQKDGTFNITKRLINELGGFIETTTPSGMKTVASVIDHDDTVMSLALAVKDIGYQRSLLKKFIYSSRNTKFKENI